MIIPKEKQGNIEVKLDQLHGELERLHSLYEQHFAGVLKKRPEHEHKRFTNAFNAIGQGDLRTTAGKFRYQGLQQKYIQFNTMWSKVLKQIEEGTYRRDLFLLHKKEQAIEKPKPQTETPKVKGEKTEPKYSKTLEVLYEKMKEMVGSAEKTPPKEQFLFALQRQLDEQKKKNPDKKIEVKLNRDANGKVQVRLGIQKKI